MPENAAILGLGSARPQHRVDQADAAGAVCAALPAGSAARRLVPRLFRLSGVRGRFSAVPDFGGDAASAGGSDGGGSLLASPPPGTAVRMRLYREHAPGLAASACRRALRSAGRAAREVTHLVVVSCTGFYAPGPDVDLVGLLGLRRDVERTVVGFMGCHGAFNGLRVARQAIGAHPGALALVVCVELCSLHFRADAGRENLVACSLFGDGAAAAVVGRAYRATRALAHLGRGITRVEPGTTAHMGWEIGDAGFEMTLSSYVPQLLAADLGSFLRPLDAGGVESWCVHPGGPAILNHVETALGLPPRGLETSRAVLSEIGNVSSATVLIVLERELARVPPGTRGALVGFGPGLTLEGLAFRRGAARSAPTDVLTVAGREA